MDPWDAGLAARRAGHQPLPPFQAGSAAAYLQRLPLVDDLAHGDARPAEAHPHVPAIPSAGEPLDLGNYSLQESLMAEYANKIEDMRTEFKKLRKVIGGEIARLTACQERATVLLKLLQKLKENKYPRFPEIREERDELAKMAHKPTVTIAILAGYIKNDFSKWVRPVQSNTSSTAFRVQTVVKFKNQIEQVCEKYYEEFNELKKQFQVMHVQYIELETTLSSIDAAMIEVKNAKANYITFALQVSSNEIVVKNEELRGFYFGNAYTQWENATRKLMQMRLEIGHLCEWLYQADMPMELSDEIQCNRALMERLQKSYQDKEAEMKKSPHFGEKQVPEVVEDEKRDSVYTPVAVSEVCMNLETAFNRLDTPRNQQHIKNFVKDLVHEEWLKSACSSARQRLKSFMFELIELHQVYSVLRKEATERLKIISAAVGGPAKIQARPREYTHCLRDTFYPLEPARPASSGGLWGFLWRGGSSPVSQSAQPEQPLDLSASANGLVWTQRNTTDILRLVGHFYRNLEMPNSLRDHVNPLLEQGPDATWGPLDYWAYFIQHAQKKIAEFNADFDKAWAKVLSLDVRYQMLQSVLMKWNDKKYASEIGPQKSFWAIFYYKLYRDVEGVDRNLKALQNDFNTFDDLLKKTQEHLQQYLRDIIDPDCQKAIEHFRHLSASIKSRWDYCNQIETFKRKLTALAPQFQEYRNPVFFQDPEAKVDQIPKPIKLDEKLGDRLREEEKLLDRVEKGLQAIEEVVTQHEVIKLQYHEHLFKMQKGCADAFVLQVLNLMSTCLFLKNTAEQITNLMPRTLSENDISLRAQLTFQLDGLCKVHQEVSDNIVAFRPLVEKAKSLLEKLIEREKAKQSSAKFKWRTEQAVMGLRSGPNILNRMQLHKDMESHCRFALKSLELLWQQIEGEYPHIYKHIESLNVKLNGEWKGWWTGYVVIPKITNPFELKPPAAAGGADVFAHRPEPKPPAAAQSTGRSGSADDHRNVRIDTD